MRKARSVQNVYKMLDEMKVAQLLPPNGTNDDLLLRVVTKGSDGSDIAAYAYRVTDNAVEVEFESVEIHLPVPFLRSMQTDPDDPIVLSLATFTNGSFAYEMLESLAEAANTEILAEPLSLSFYNSAGSITHNFSSDPLRVSMQAHTRTNAVCAYWDDVQSYWSTTGMTLEEAANGTMTCQIRFDQLPILSASNGDPEAALEPLPPRKPSLFSVIFRAVGATFACSMAAEIYSLEGLKALVAEENLMWVVRWPAITTWATLVAGVALLLRARRADREYEDRLKKLLRKDTARQMLMEQAKKEFVILAKLRQFVELSQELQKSGVRRMASEIVHRKMVQAQLGVDYEFLHSLYKVSGQTALHLEARHFLERFHNADPCRQLISLYTTYCQWFRVLEPALRVTCVERGAVMLCKFYSGLAVAAAFYNQGAVARGEEGCEFNFDPLRKAVQTIVVAWVSMVVGLLPFFALMPLFEKLRGLELQLRHVIFWTIITAYFLFCLITVCIFQASVSFENGLDWMLSALQTLANTLIVTPTLMATVVLLLLRATNIDLDDHLPFHEMDDHRYKVTLRKMAVSGDTLKKQLEAYKSHDLCAMWEIAGHPETATVTNDLRHGHESDAEICLDGIMAQQALLAVVYAKSHKSEGLRLVGSAILPVASILESGFEGEIELFQRGVKLEGAYVSVSIEKPDFSQLVNLPKKGRGSIRLSVINNAVLPDLPPEIVLECNLAGIGFEGDNISHEDDLQRKCDLMGISFDSDEEVAQCEDLRAHKSQNRSHGDVGDVSAAFTIVPLSEGTSSSNAFLDSVYGVGDPVLLRLHGKIVSGSVVDPGTGSSPGSLVTVLVERSLHQLPLSHLMPNFEENDDVHVLVEEGDRQWKAGRVVSELPEGFSVEVSGSTVVTHPERMRRCFPKGSTILIYQRGWVEALVSHTVVEEPLLHRNGEVVQVQVSNSELTLLSCLTKPRTAFIST